MPEATVAAIVSTTDRSKVLLTRRSIDPFKDQWCLPGGHIDQYEPVGEAIIREVKEETGLDFNAEFFDYFDEVIPKYNIHAVVLVFEGDAFGELDASESEVSDARWFSLVEARSILLAFTHNDVLDAYAARIKTQVDKR